MDSFISTFHIDWKILIAQAINFGIIFLLLYFFALKPLKKIMGERTNVIEKGIEDAKRNAELITTTQKEYEESIAKARREAQILFQEGKKETEAKKREMMEKAEQEVGIMIASGKKNLEAEKVKMIEEAKGQIVSLVVAATEKILMDQSDKTITDKAIKKISNI
jgi:F-type H+-transporting ATPase subunit b